jgi:hypothetical protein
MGVNIRNGAEQIIIDPYLDNKRAIKAYQGAGFHQHSLHDTDEGEICLMIYFKANGVRHVFAW